MNVMGASSLPSGWRLKVVFEGTSKNDNLRINRVDFTFYSPTFHGTEVTKSRLKC